MKKLTRIFSLICVYATLALVTQDASANGNWFCSAKCEDWKAYRAIISAGLWRPSQKFRVTGRGESRAEAYTDMAEDCDGTLSDVYCGGPDSRE